MGRRGGGGRWGLSWRGFVGRRKQGQQPGVRLGGGCAAVRSICPPSAESRWPRAPPGLPCVRPASRKQVARRPCVTAGVIPREAGEGGGKQGVRV